MAKDPAFLFYSQDFQTGTQFFTDEQVGKYLRLLIAQHQHGHLSEKQVLMICKTFDKELMLKFEKDSTGNFFNQRLEDEILKRKSFSESRKLNRLGKTKKTKQHKKNISLTSVNDMENENENENINKKEKENKVEIEKSVFATQTEIEKLKEKFGAGYLWAVETLSNYKQSSGKKYKSDYHALIGWVHDKFLKEKNQLNGKQQVKNPYIDKSYFKQATD